MKREWQLIIAGLVIAAGIGLIYVYTPAPAAPVAVSFDPQNATYVINGQNVALLNGFSQTPAAPGSALMVTTRIFGTPASGDLNGDGRPDAAMLITQDSGGSGTFFYVAAALNSSQGTMGTNAFYLGDRIAPQNISINNGVILVNYADRYPGEPMTTRPSLGVSKYFAVQGGALVEIKQ